MGVWPLPGVPVNYLHFTMGNLTVESVLSTAHGRRLEGGFCIFPLAEQ